MRNPERHGGDVYAAARDLRQPIGNILDFSASINPLGPSPDVYRVLVESVRLAEHYPDPHCVVLRQVLGNRWKLSPEQFVVGNGSTELIDLIPRALALRSAIIVGPTFSEYRNGLRRMGAQIAFLHASSEDGYRPPVKELLARLESRNALRTFPQAIFVCNPNSPTGQVCNHGELISLIQRADRHGIWTILDETFVDYCPEQSMLPELHRHRRLILLRSFTKFYGLPGLRIGYSISSPRMARLLREYQAPWSVNTMAQRAAEEAIQNQEHIARSLDYVKRERERFVKRLRSFTGLKIFDSWANFLLLELPRRYRSGVVTAQLRRAGILIRDCSFIPGLNRRTIRIAVRRRAENERLIKAFREILG